MPLDILIPVDLLSGADKLKAEIYFIHWALTVFWKLTEFTTVAVGKPRENGFTTSIFKESET